MITKLSFVHAYFFLICLLLIISVGTYIFLNNNFIYIALTLHIIFAYFNGREKLEEYLRNLFICCVFLFVPFVLIQSNIAESLIPKNQWPVNTARGGKEMIDFNKKVDKVYNKKLAEKKKIFNQCYDKLTE